MTDPYGLFRVAEDEEIPVIPFSLPENGSLCLHTDSMDYIAMDETVLSTEADRNVHLAHELGHCIKGAFYNQYAARDLREKQENTADKWAISKLIPRDRLLEAFADGITEVWSLAEWFSVTEDFVRKAVCWYANGNLAIDKYL